MKSSSHESWKLLLFNGLIALVFGILAIFASKAVIITILVYFGILLLIAGIAMLFGVYSNFKGGLPYGFDLLESIVVLVLGVFLTFYSQQSLKVFVIVVGVWAILTALAQLYYSFSLPSDYQGKSTFLINGFITLAFGILMLFNPFEMASFVIVLAGVISLLVGILLIVISLKMKSYRININIDE